MRGFGFTDASLSSATSRSPRSNPWQHMSAGRRTGSLHLSFLTTTPPFITNLACSNFDPLNLSLLHNRLHLIERHVCGTAVHNHLERDRHGQGGMRVVFPWERRGEDAAPACGIL